METVSLTQLAQELIAAAREASSGRSARKLYGDRDATLRQTLIALAAGNSLGEHDSPPEATFQLLSGRVRFHTATDEIELAAGDLLVIPRDRHDVTALEDSAFVLTVRV